MKTKAGKKVLLTLVCAALTIALGACSGDKAGKESSQITIGIPQDVDSLDPHKAVAAGTKEVLFNVFEGLVKPDSEGNLNDAVAESHTISEDGKVYTFTLRDGVKFHDGTTVTAEDVKYSIDRCADTSNGDPLVSAFLAIDSVNIIDEKTVEIVLKEGNTDFLPYLTAAILPAANEDPESNPIGTGPYKYVSRSPQENVILEKFDEYWGTPANIDTVKLQVIANADTIVTSLNGGSVDMFARISQAQADQLSDDFDVLEGTMNLVQAMYLNNAKEPFNDVRVRQALCYAVDPQGIMDMISDGKGAQIGSSMFPSFGKYYMEELNDLYATNIEKAKELLTEAGYPDGFSFTLTVPSNYQQPIEMQLTYQVDGEPLEQLPNGYSDHYVPDGYERDREQEFERAENFLHVYSSKESGKGYTVRCSIIQPGQQSSFDNEHTTYENVKVGDADATLGTSVGENGDTVYILSWERGGVSNTIMGNISRDEIVRIAENVF